MTNIPKVEFPESDVTVNQEAYLLGWGSASVSSATLTTNYLRKELKKIKLSITSTEITYSTAYENNFLINTNAFSAKSVNSSDHINNVSFSNNFEGGFVITRLSTIVLFHLEHFVIIPESKFWPYFSLG